MAENIHAVALRAVKYNDKTTILTVWTAEYGQIGLLMPAGRSRESMRRRALTQPLSLFECLADIRPGRELCHVSDLRPVTPFATIHTNGMKASIAMFLAEALSKTLRGGGDIPLWQFIARSLADFDAMSCRQAANFHLWFLTQLAFVLGFGPDCGDYRPGMIFDIDAARFTTVPTASGRCLAGDHARLAHILMTCHARRLSLLSLNPQTRADILDTILDYYARHHQNPRPLRTLDILPHL